MVPVTAAKHKLAEILVVRDKDSCFAFGPGQDSLIVRLRHDFGDGEHVVAGRAQAFDDGRTGGFIHDELHGVRYARPKRRAGIRPRPQATGQRRSEQRGYLEAAIADTPQDISLQHSLCEHPNDELHRDTRSSDHRLAGHDPGVYVDMFPQLFIHLRILPHLEVEDGETSFWFRE